METRREFLPPEATDTGEIIINSVLKGQPTSEGVVIKNFKSLAGDLQRGESAQKILEKEELSKEDEEKAA